MKVWSAWVGCVEANEGWRGRFGRDYCSEGNYSHSYLIHLYKHSHTNDSYTSLLTHTHMHTHAHTRTRTRLSFNQLLLTLSSARCVRRLANRSTLSGITLILLLFYKYLTDSSFFFINCVRIRDGNIVVRECTRWLAY